MRKAALYLLFVSLVVVFAACGGSPTSPTSAPTQAAPLSIYFSTSDVVSGIALYALNASDGSIRWSQKGSQYPILESGVIYASNYGRDSGIAAFAASDGRLLWFYHSTGTADITSVVNGVLYAAIASLPSGYVSMYALNARDGTVLWHAEQPHVENGDAVVDAIVYAFMAKRDSPSGLFGEAAFNAQNGDVLWKYQPADGTPSFVQASNGHVSMLVRSQDTATQVYLVSLNASDGSVRWRYPQTGYADLQMLGEAQGLVYLNSQDDATLYALNASDGSIKWHVPKGAKNFSLRPLLTNATLYAGLPNGTVYALNTSDGSLKWQAHVGHAGMRPEDIATSPTATGDGAVYVSQNGLFALNASDGALQWVHAAAPDVPVAVTALNGVVYAYTINVNANTSTISAFKGSDGSTRWSYQTGLVLIPPIVG